MEITRGWMLSSSPRQDVQPSGTQTCRVKSSVGSVCPWRENAQAGCLWDWTECSFDGWRGSVQGQVEPACSPVGPGWAVGAQEGCWPSSPLAVRPGLLTLPAGWCGRAGSVLGAEGAVGTDSDHPCI